MLLLLPLPPRMLALTLWLRRGDGVRFGGAGVDAADEYGDTALIKVRSLFLLLVVVVLVVLVVLVGLAAAAANRDPRRRPAGAATPAARCGCWRAAATSKPSTTTATRR